MHNLAATLYCRSPIPFMVLACVALMQFGVNAAQSSGPQTSSVAERVEQLERDVAQLKSEFRLREELSRLQKDAAKSKSGWVQSAPWLVLGIVGIAFAVGWSLVNWKERSASRNRPDPKVVKELADVVRSIGGDLS